MPSPLAHGVLIILVRPMQRRGMWPAAPGRPTFVLYILLAIALLLPDVDFVIGWVWPNTILGTHAGGTHSLPMGFVAALAMSVIGWGVIRRGFLRIFTLLLAAIWSHVLMDAVTWGGRGVAMFWPITDIRIVSPISIFYGVRHSQPEAWQLHLITLATELVFVLAVVFLSRRRGEERRNVQCSDF